MESLLITPINVEAQNEGTWTDYYGVHLKIGRANNPVFKKIMIKVNAGQELRNEIPDPDDREEENVKILAKSVGEGLLFDWQDHPSGAPYSKENSCALMLQDPDCRAFVIAFSNNIENYHRDNVVLTLEK